MGLLSFLREWSEARRFKALPAKLRSIVFYAEDAGSWTHLAPIVRELCDVRGLDVCYLTSSWQDPVLADGNPRFHSFCIGEGTVRTLLFVGLEAGVMVLTMPDLETFHIKRSKSAPVHYVYVFHSLVSTHMIYRKGAFDHFDTVLCSGPHHVRELRATEARYGLPEKELVEHGYGRLDAILAENPPAPARDGRSIRVLVAPSWGPEGILETRADELLDALLDAGFEVVVRPHPMTSRRDAALLESLRRRAEDHVRLTLDVDMSSWASLRESDVMISDWSGAALEYAFGLERPVLFLDLPRKVNNPEYEVLGLEPIEVSVREEIGEVLAPDRLADLPRAIESLCSDRASYRERLREARSRHVFHVGTSGAVAAEHIGRLAGRSSGEASR